MPKGVSGPTWALLSPSKLPNASEAEKILGAIVPDYENPLQNPIPEDARKIIPAAWFAMPTEDENFKVLLDRAKGNNAHTRLGDILNTAFRRNISNNLHLTSITVKTYAVKEEIKAFNLLKKKYKQDIVELIDRAPSRNNRSVFAIEAIKTCRNAEISSKDTRENSKKEDTMAPIKDIIASSTNFPQLLGQNAQRTEELIETINTDESHTAKGERIFAVQYRIVRNRSGWPKIWGSKPPADFDLNDLYVPGGPSMYGNGDEKDDGEDLELDDENDDDDDPIELGDIEHTWNLLSSGDDEIVMTTL